MTRTLIALALGLALGNPMLQWVAGAVGSHWDPDEAAAEGDVGSQWDPNGAAAEGTTDGEYGSRWDPNG